MSTNPKEVLSHNDTIAAITGLLDGQPKATGDQAWAQGEGFETWEQSVHSVATKELEPFLVVLKDAIQQGPSIELYQQDPIEYGIQEAMQSQRINVLTDAARDRGATRLDLTRVYLEVAPTHEDQQCHFELMRSDGFDGLSYEQVGQLMEEFNLEWGA